MGFFHQEKEQFEMWVRRVEGTWYLCSDLSSFNGSAERTLTQLERIIKRGKMNGDNVARV